MSPLSPQQLDEIARDIGNQNQRDRSMFRVAVVVVCIVEIIVVIWAIRHWSLT